MDICKKGEISVDLDIKVARMPDMTTEGQRACVVCGKPAYRNWRRCGYCQLKRMRATHIGAKGCSICGGKVTVPGGTCRKCWDESRGRAVQLIKDAARRGVFLDHGTPTPLNNVPRYFDGEES